MIKGRFLLFLVTSTTLLLYAESEVSVACSYESITEDYCPGDVAKYFCNTTHKLLEWTVNDHEVDFSGLDETGAVEFSRQCNMSGMLVQHDPYFSSLLTLTVSQKLNNTPVQCYDPLDGTAKRCLIKVQAPPHQPSGLNITVLNSSTAMVKWVPVFPPSNISQQSIQYKVAAKPITPYCDYSCTRKEILTDDVMTNLSDLDLLKHGYEIAVTALNCFGRLESQAQIESVTPLNYDVIAMYGTCGVQFSVNISWSGYELTETAEVVLNLKSDNTSHSVINQFGPLKGTIQLLIGNITDLQSSKEYDWEVVLVLSSRSIFIGQGSFNTSEKCNEIRPVINKTAAVFLSLMVLMVVVLVVCFSAAVVVFLYMRTHRMQAGNRSSSITITVEKLKTGNAHDSIKMDNVKRSDEEEIYIHEAGELKKDPHMLHTSIPLEGVSSLLMDNLPLILVNSLGET